MPLSYEQSAKQGNGLSHMIALIGYLVVSLLAVVVIFGVGAAIYELYIVKHDRLDDRDYTRSHDWWTQSNQ
ncbi:MAG: hypothetical protein AAGK74_20180 [Chloroflexota bacterium]